MNHPGRHPGESRGPGLKPAFNNMPKDWIPAFAGMTAYVVGGAVRDRFLRRTIFDYDIVIEKDPKAIAEKVARLTGGSAFPLDEERGIMRIALESGIHIDIAKIQGQTFTADIDRRDLTINELAVPLERWESSDWKKFVVDRHDGQADLKTKTIKPVSPKAFVEDPLRLLRAIRIAAELDFKISSDCLKAITKHKKLIRKPAPERKRDEMLRIFATGRAYEALIQLDKTGLLDEIFPEAPALRKTAPVYYGKGGVLKHTLDSVQFFEEIMKDKTWFPGLNAKIASYMNEHVAGHPRYAHCKWALLLHDIGKPATMKKIGGRLRFFEHEHVGADKVPKMAKQFRWSSDETTQYSRLVRNHMRPGNLATNAPITDKAIHRFFRDLGDDAVAMLLVSLADHLTYLSKAQRLRRNSAHERITIKMIRRYYTSREKVIPPKLVTGYDLMKTFNLKPSPLIGNLLRDLNETQSEGRIRTKDEALKYLSERFPWHQKEFEKKQPNHS